MTPKMLRESLHSIAPDSFSTMFDYDTSIECLNKKLTKSLQRTISFCDDTCAYQEDPIKVLFIIFKILKYFSLKHL